MKKFSFLLLVSTLLHARSQDQNNFGQVYRAGILQNLLLAQNSEPATNNLNLESPTLEAKPDSSGYSNGVVSDLNFGGTVDARLYLPRPHGKTDEQIGFGNFDLHVVEVFLTTSVGEHISVLVEQLLVTSDMGNTVGQDHGFVYATFSNIPGLSDNITLKLGRFRNRFGIDAKLDAPANPMKSPVYYSLGTVTDKGAELSGYWKWFDWSFGISNGVDTIEDMVMTTGGEMIHVNRELKNPNKPLFSRFGFELSDSFQVGLSGYTGKTYAVVSDQSFSMQDMTFNARLDKTKIVQKDRVALDLKYRLGQKIDLYGEYGFGQDKFQGQVYKPYTAYGRLDYRVIPGKFSLQTHYLYFEDGRPKVAADGSDRDTGNLGLSGTYFINDQAWLRLVAQVDDRGIFRSKNNDAYAPEYLGTLQTLVAF